MLKINFGNKKFTFSTTKISKLYNKTYLDQNCLFRNSVWDFKSILKTLPGIESVMRMIPCQLSSFFNE